MTAVPAAVWDAGDYAAASGHHRREDSRILDPLALRPGMRVLDLGCGTGELAATIAGIVAPAGAAGTGGEVVGAEPQPSLYAAASERSRPGLRFVQSTAQQLPAGLGPFDVVVSVAMLHWIPAGEQHLALERVAAVLRPGGLLRLDFGGEGQIAAAREAIAPVAQAHGLPVQPWFFPSVETYRSLLEGAGFSLESGWCTSLQQRRSFPGAGDLRGWLRSQVLNAYAAGLEPAAAEAFYVEAEARCAELLRREDGTFDQDYVRLDILATRP